MFVIAFDWCSALGNHAEVHETATQIQRWLRDHPPDVFHMPFEIGERSIGSAVFRERQQLDAFIRGPIARLEQLPGATCRHHIYPYHRELDGVLQDPVIIISAPRSGSTLLHELLAESPDAFTIGAESFQLIDGFPPLSLQAHEYRSHALTAVDATEPIIRLVRAGFTAGLRDRDRRPALDPSGIERHTSLRLVEKTPRNCLRVPFMHRVFPDARFVFLVREPRSTMSSMMEKWHGAASTGFNVTLPGWSAGEAWPEGKWLGLLPEGWPALDGASLAEIVAFKWASANRHILAAMDQLPRDRWIALRFDELVGSPIACMERLCTFANLTLDPRARRRSSPPLAHSASVVSTPAADKWRRHEPSITSVMPSLVELIEQIESRVGRFTPTN